MIALVTALVFTLPSTGQHRWIDPSHDSDSVMVECDGGEPISSLEMAYLWRYLQGQGFARVDSHAVSQPGLVDSFVVNQDGLYYVTTRNAVGESCAGNVHQVGTPTGIDPQEASRDPIVRRRTFDVRGRLVAKRASGIYFEKVWRKSGRTETRKVAVLK